MAIFVRYPGLSYTMPESPDESARPRAFRPAGAPPWLCNQQFVGPASVLQSDFGDLRLRARPGGPRVYSPPMANQIVLAWTVDVANTTFDPAQPAAALSAVPLYLHTTTHPLLGPLLRLPVASDTTPTATP